MSKLGRFTKIEGARDKPPVEADHDPFAPPPEAKVVDLALDHREDESITRAREERERNAQAKLVAAEEQLAERAERDRPPPPTALELFVDKQPLARMAIGMRVFVFVIGFVAIAVIGAAAGAYVWGLAPIWLALFVASFFAKKT